jgi:toxin ParE1/3/4
LKLVWLPLAQQLRFAQLDYIAERNPHAALRVDSEIEQQADRLQDHPDMGRMGRVKGTRELVVQRTPFILVYRVRPTASRVEVLRVLHGAQQWPPDEAES